MVPFEVAFPRFETHSKSSRGSPVGLLHPAARRFFPLFLSVCVFNQRARGTKYRRCIIHPPLPLPSPCVCSAYQDRCAWSVLREQLRQPRSYCRSFSLRDSANPAPGEVSGLHYRDSSSLPMVTPFWSFGERSSLSFERLSPPYEE